MKFTIAAIFSAVATAVYAQTAAPANAGVAVNLPSFGQVITAGQPFTITWTVEGTNPSANINSIALMGGSSQALDTIIPNILSAPIPVNPPQYVWNIPATVPTMPSYALALAGDNGATTYSTYFTIIGAAPGTTNGTIVTSAPAASASGVKPAASPSPSASNATASPSETKAPSAANNLKAGVACAVGVAGAVALLF